MPKQFAALALLLVACGGGGDQGNQQEAAAEPAATPATDAAPAPGTGTVHEVRMLLTDDGAYQYEPSALTIRVGDTVRWINVNDIHNVAFYADQIPEGASARLEALMPTEGKMGPLSGRLLSQAGDVYEMTFADVPSGTYGYYCTPHEALGMVASLTVQP